MTPRTLRNLLPWCGLILVGLGAAWLRYGLVEQPALADLCTVAAAPAWCPLRQALVLGFLHEAYGVAALAASALALWRRSIVLATLAAALGGFALVLYNFEPGALALLLGCLRLVRLQGVGNPPVATTPAH